MTGGFEPCPLVFNYDRHMVLIHTMIIKYCPNAWFQNKMWFKDSINVLMQALKLNQLYNQDNLLSFYYSKSFSLSSSGTSSSWSLSLSENCLYLKHCHHRHLSALFLLLQISESSLAMGPSCIVTFGTFYFPMSTMVDGRRRMIRLVKVYQKVCLVVNSLCFLVVEVQIWRYTACRFISHFLPFHCSRSPPYNARSKLQTDDN